MNEIRDAILRDQPDAVEGLAVPESCRAVVVRKDVQDMFEGMATRETGLRVILDAEVVSVCMVDADGLLHAMDVAGYLPGRLPQFAASA